MLSYMRSLFKTDDANDDDDDEAADDYDVNIVIPLVKSAFETDYLSKCLDVPRPEDTTLKELLTLSAEFSTIKFPVKSVRCIGLKYQSDITTDRLEHNANSAYPLLHEAAVTLYIEFLEYKRKYGSRVEKALYANMGLLDLVQRFVDKRAVTFSGVPDCYVLLSGETGMGGWEAIGSDNEAPPLILENCLSYDEIKLSAFLALSCYSVFINDGNRHNCGRTSVTATKDIERHGVVVGIVGPRLSAGVSMEAEEILITKTQNVSENGYGSLSIGRNHKWRQMWAAFYGVKRLSSYSEVKRARRSGNESLRTRFVKLDAGLFFDNEIYAKRVSIGAKLLLLEADSRAAAANKSAFLHVVGFGLGAWRISKHQEKVFLDSFAKSLKELCDVIHHVSDVNFAWFQRKSHGMLEDEGVIGDGDNKIHIHFTNRPPHSKLKEPNKLLVVLTSQNSNALPGNQFWINQLQTSGDSANACSTQVSELQNAHVNRKISGANLHVASSEWGVLHIKEYARRKLDK